MEQREAMSNLNDSHYTNGNNNHWMMNGFALACVKAMEGYKPRQRGCLKHVRLESIYLSVCLSVCLSVYPHFYGPQGHPYYCFPTGSMYVYIRAATNSSVWYSDIRLVSRENIRIFA